MPNNHGSGNGGNGGNGKRGKITFYAPVYGGPHDGDQLIIPPGEIIDRVLACALLADVQPPNVRRDGKKRHSIYLWKPAEKVFRFIKTVDVGSNEELETETIKARLEVG